METYYYVNVFETKGLEMLLLIAFLLLLVFLFKYLKTPSASMPAEKRERGFPARRGPGQSSSITHADE